MAWTASKVFANMIGDVLSNAAALDLSGDTSRVALFNDTITPDNTVSSANSAYGAGVWASGGVSDNADGWLTIGEPLVSPTITVSTTNIKWSAENTASSTTSVSLTNATGALIYDDTVTTPVADQGICFIWFGGSNTVVDGTFTVVWSASGIMSFSAA